MFKIYAKERDYFYQWELNQKIVIDAPIGTRVNFQRVNQETAAVGEVYELDNICVANVPNEILQIAEPFLVWLVENSDDMINVLREHRYNVLKTQRPDDYVYSEEDVKRWEDLEQRISDIEENGGGGGGSGGNYTLPIATPDTLGGVKPVEKGEDMTQEVGVDGEGRLWTAQGGGAGEKPWTLIKTVTLTEDVSNVLISTDTDGNAFACDELYAKMYLHRANTSGGNLRFGVMDVTDSYYKTWELVMATSDIGQNNTYHTFYAYKHKATGDVMCELRYSPYENNPQQYKAPPGISRDGRFRKFELDHSTAGGYIGATTIITLYGR